MMEDSSSRGSAGSASGKAASKLLIGVYGMDRRDKSVSKSLDHELAELAERQRKAEAVWESGPRRFETGLGGDIHLSNPNFYGEKSKSFMQGCHPGEARLLKKLVGSDYEQCVLNDGTVKFTNRQQERGFAAALEAARVKNSVDPGFFLRPEAQARRRALAAGAPGS